MKVLKWLAIVPLVIALLVYALLYYDNNHRGAEYSKDSLTVSYDASIAWLEGNREQLLQEHNPALWWMLSEALAKKNNPRLRRILKQYRRQSRAAYADTPMRYLVYGSSPAIDPLVVLNSAIPYYNKHYIYAFTCDSELLDYQAISAQNEAGFCLANHPISPACLTHQVIGLRFVERNDCALPAEPQTLIAQLANWIAWQLVFDVRLVDVYIQRVMVLVESGFLDRVKHRWVSRILEAQLADGGWADFQPLVALGGDRYLGFGPKFFTVEKPQSSFHATAQAVLLLSLLIDAEAGG